MRYRKRPVVIEAIRTDAPVTIETLEGVMTASPGDYIITGVKGERYPRKPDIFEATYEPVEDQAPAETPSPTFYDCRDSEQLSHESPEDAILEYIDTLAEPSKPVEDTIRELGSITVTAYRRVKVGDDWIEMQARRLAERLGEEFSERFGDPDGDDCDEQIAESWRDFVPAVRAAIGKARVWSCEPCGKHVYSVNEVLELARRMCPEWFS